MNEQQYAPPAEPVATESDEIHSQLSRLAEDGLDLGRLWASHGLNLGRLALETSARTLSITANMLSELSQNFVSRKKQ